jgi:hypothetical protein
MQSEWSEAAYKLCENEKVIVAMALIHHLAKAFLRLWKQC